MPPRVAFTIMLQTNCVHGSCGELTPHIITHSVNLTPAIHSEGGSVQCGQLRPLGQHRQGEQLHTRHDVEAL